MRCPACGLLTICDRAKWTVQCYFWFRCVHCGKQFNDHNTGVLIHVRYSSDVIALRCSGGYVAI